MMKFGRKVDRHDRQIRYRYNVTATAIKWTEDCSLQLVESRSMGKIIALAFSDRCYPSKIKLTRPIETCFKAAQSVEINNAHYNRRIRQN
jgi:hypothetical protein